MNKSYAKQVKTLNDIYKGAVVEWKIKPDIFHLDVEELEGHIFEDTGSGLTSPYTSHMKLVRKKLKKEHDIEKDVLYLFFVQHNQTTGMKGYMPLGYQYGFIYVDQIQLVHIHETIAHELGHGAFRLRHTFSDHATYKQTQGTTANLMDYSKGNELWKYQWDLIHDPENMLFKWGQDEEEGRDVSKKLSNEELLCIYNEVWKEKITDSGLNLDGIDPLEFDKAVELAESTDLVQSEVFKNISPSLIKKQVEQRVKSSKGGRVIRQGDFWLCGPAAACHIIATLDPVQYVKVVFDLYSTGYANDLFWGIGGISAIGNDLEGITEAKPNSAGNISGIPAVDFILMHSLRYSENDGFLSFPLWRTNYNASKNDKFNFGTWPNEFIDLLSRLSPNIKVGNRGILKHDDLPILKKNIDEGDKVVFFIDSRRWRNQSPDKYSALGRHFIVVYSIDFYYNGKTIDTFTDNFKIGYWDHGSRTIKYKSFSKREDFDALSKQYYVIRRKEWYDF